MTELKKAARAALDALEIYGAQAPAVHETITALREALAEQPAQQEPVANYCRECLTYNGHHEGCSHYTSPPAQRTWAGLTDEEIVTLFNKTLNGKPLDVNSMTNFARSIEAKLKEKNA